MEDKVNDILRFPNYVIIMFSIKCKLIKIYANWIEKKVFNHFQMINVIIKLCLKPVFSDAPFYNFISQGFFF